MHAVALQLSPESLKRRAERTSGRFPEEGKSDFDPVAEASGNHVLIDRLQAYSAISKTVRTAPWAGQSSVGLNFLIETDRSSGTELASLIVVNDFGAYLCFVTCRNFSSATEVASGP